MTFLYKQPEAWGLPSLCVACIEVEAYLRLAEVPFHVEMCSSSTRSPSGQLPALEKGTLVAGFEPSSQTTRNARDACFKFLRRHCKDLDEGLTNAQKAEVLAYTVLVQEKLALAVQLSLWLDPRGFRELRKAMRHLPFPLNYLITWSEQRRVQQQHKNFQINDVFAEAEFVLAKLADRIAASRGPFFFGSEPCSLDAQLASVLMYIQSSDAVLPALQKKVQEQRELRTYIDYITAEYFSEPAPGLPPGTPLATRASWGAATSEAPQDDKPATPEPTAAEKQVQRGNYLWILGVGAAAALYVLLGGQHFKFDFRHHGLIGVGHGGDDDDDDDDDDDGDDGDEEDD